MNIYIKGFNLVKKKFKLSFLLLIVITLIGAILEGISIALILPLLNLLLNPDEIFSNEYLNLSFILGYELSYLSIIYFYSTIFFLIYFIKNIFLILINFTQSKILLNINFYLSNLYFSKLLNQNYLSLIEEKSSTVIRTMISQTTGFASKFINSATILISEFLTLIFIISFVFIVTEKGLYLIILLLVTVLAIYYFILKKKNISISQEN